MKLNSTLSCAKGKLGEQATQTIVPSTVQMYASKTDTTGPEKMISFAQNKLFGCFWSQPDTRFKPENVTFCSKLEAILLKLENPNLWNQHLQSTASRVCGKFELPCQRMNVFGMRTVAHCI
jgi:hypothetical protein